MNLFKLALFAAIWFLNPLPLNAQSAPNDETRRIVEQLISPSVRVYTASGSSSGVVLFSGMHKDKYRTIVLTNQHVVADEKVDDLKLSHYGSEERITVRILHEDKQRDLAILEATDPFPSVPVRIAKTEPFVGQGVIAVGSPLGQGLFVGPWGVVSQLGFKPFGASPTDRSFMVSSVPIQRGFSGGGLFFKNDTTGNYELIGINTMTLTQFFVFTASIPVGDVRLVIRNANLEFILQ